jgi:hypothetical protein
MNEKPSKGTPTDLSGDAVEEISSTLRRLVADVFALYVKTRTFIGTSAGGAFAITTCCSTSGPRKCLRCFGQRTKGPLC